MSALFSTHPEYASLVQAMEQPVEVVPFVITDEMAEGTDDMAGLTGERNDC